jgi:hypothetical protein
VSKASSKANARQKSPTIYYEDPANALNPTEEQWNSIVKNNYEKHYEEERQKKQRMLEKSKAI